VLFRGFCDDSGVFAAEPRAEVDDEMDMVDSVDPTGSGATGENTRAAAGLRHSRGPKLVGAFAGRVFMTVLK